MDRAVKNSQHLPSAGAHLVVMMVLGLIPELMMKLVFVVVLFFFTDENEHPRSSACMEQLN